MARKKAVPSPTPLLQKNADTLSRAQALLIAGILALIAGLLYAPSSKFEYAFDDDVYTQLNKVSSEGLGRVGDIFGKGTVYGFSGENFGTYRPITLLSFALEKSPDQVFDPGRSHRVNIFLYALCAFVLFATLLQLLPQKPWMISFLITLLFVVHPVHTEVVANVKSREEILALLFGLASIWLLLGATGKRQWLCLVGSAAAYTLALLSKESTFPWVLVFPLVIWLFTERSLKSLLLQSSIFVALGLFFYYLRLFIFDPIPAGSGVSDTFINNFVMAGDTFGERLATMISVWGHYLGLLFYPHTLRPDYSFSQIPITNWSNPLVYLVLVAYTAIGLGAIWLVAKRQKLGFGLGFFLLTLSTAAITPLLFRNVSALAERFLFTPSLGFCFALVLGGYALWQSVRPQAKPWLYYGLIGLICLAGIIKSSQQIPVWQNNQTVFTHSAQVSPNSFRAHLNLAEVVRTQAEKTPPQNAQRKGIFQRSIASYERSLAIYAGEGNTWYNVGVCYQAIGQTNKAINAFNQALSLGKQKGASANNLGVIYFQSADYVRASNYFRQASEAEPNNPDHLVNLGSTYENSGDLSSALTAYRKALQLQPNHQRAQQGIARIQ
ncbi:MAG: tetratricopeptide repeat protein [Bacteroidia bacterium]